MTTCNQGNLMEMDFTLPVEGGLLICAGGFEDRALAFARRLNERTTSFERVLVLRYESQREDNRANLDLLLSQLSRLTRSEPLLVSVNADSPIRSCSEIADRVKQVSEGLTDPRTYIDVSAMTHLWALSMLHECLSQRLDTQVVYTEARWYFPTKREAQRLLRAWRDQEYETASEYLQSKALKAVHIPPEFGGNLRPGKQACLMLFAGYEPNRVAGLVDAYAPGALVVLYGRSPRPELEWRSQLSRDLHKDLFSRWHLREIETSTLLVDETLQSLETEFDVVREQYDVAVAPQCSKMQALASYLFWRRHPEVQLLFTTPVRFNPARYSSGSGRTYVYRANVLGGYLTTLPSPDSGGFPSCGESG